MKTTKIFVSLTIGALIILGLFLFLRSRSQQNIVTTSIKPSQLDFTQSNHLPESRTQEIKPTESAQIKAQPFIENLSASEKAQWETFETILKTKNDNDPRLDQEFKKLSVAFKQALYQKYDSLPPENHSGRGLIVYLIGRDLSSVNDIQFLKKIYEEPPCLSMNDCKTAPKDNDPHHSSMDQTTLIYEQLSALYLIEKHIAQNPDLLSNASSRSELNQVLAQAENYPIPAVHEKARAIRTKYGL